MTVNKIIDDILQREGGYVHLPADRGGPTFRGVTAKAWGEYAHLGRAATPLELQSLTEQQVRGFYFDRHIAPYQNLPDPMRVLLADWSVTSWHDDPVKALQIELAKAGLYKGKIDGMNGPVTQTGLKALLSSGRDHRAFYLELAKARVRQLVNEALDGDDVQRFIELHPKTELRFLRGWVNRGLEFVS